MRKKLQSGRGETLVELMASIVIGTLSVALLLGGVMASTSIGRTARGLDKDYYEHLSAAEGRTGAPLPGQLTVENKGSGVRKTFSVGLYGGGEMYSYALEETGP